MGLLVHCRSAGALSFPIPVVSRLLGAAVRAFHFFFQPLLNLFDQSSSQLLDRAVILKKVGLTTHINFDAVIATVVPDQLTKLKFLMREACLQLGSQLVLQFSFSGRPP